MCWSYKLKEKHEDFYLSKKKGRRRRRRRRRRQKWRRTRKSKERWCSRGAGVGGGRKCQDG
jgi:hypothetical protein